MSPIHNKKPQTHEDVLEAIAEAIDVPEHLDDIARKRYASIGDWLDREESSIRQYEPEIYPQGSFLLGTVIRPVGDSDEYDVDLVCTLNATKADFTMADLKEAIGVEIKSYAKANSIKKEPDDGRRCWTLEYSNSANFHMDILPALPNADSYRVMLEKKRHFSVVSNRDLWSKAIAITDKTDPNFRVRSEDWPVSNPKGYAVWFNSRQVDAVTARKQKLMEHENIYASVDDIPDHKIKTPLQRAIQLLKRHRDTIFEGDENKPVSVIITTLAAHCYANEETISEALQSILKGMTKFIKVRNGEKWISNPVNPEENFADKWKEEPDKELKFNSWLETAQRDFGMYMKGSTFDQIPEGLTMAMTSATIQKVLPSAAMVAPVIIAGAAAVAAEVSEIENAGAATKPWCR